MRIAVVGAGVVGLATAYELARSSDAEVRCYEQGEPMAARSVGDTRVFRLGHGDPALVDLALQAEAHWDRWSEAFGTRLIEPTSTVLSGGSVPRWQAAMTTAGAPARVTDDPTGLGLPAANPAGPFLVDERGGVVDVRASGRGLRAALRSIVRSDDRVVGLDLQGDLDRGVRVRAASGAWDCDIVLLVAGAGTPALAASAGLDAVPTHVRHHHRFTFRVTEPSRTPPCWLDQSESWRPGYTTYQHRSSSGHWAIGGSLDVVDTGWELGEQETRRRARAAVLGYAAATFDGVAPEIVGVVHCDSMALGDGIGTAQRGPVLALWGDNLMKFAPVLGSLLARSAVAGELVDELRRLPAAQPAAGDPGSRTAPR